jgi:hypothetical protein
MCHDHVDWTRDRERTAEDVDESEEVDSEHEEMPAFLNEDGAEDVELLTDGGDE